MAAAVSANGSEQFFNAGSADERSSSIRLANSKQSIPFQLTIKNHFYDTVVRILYHTSLKRELINIAIPSILKNMHSSHKARCTYLKEGLLASCSLDSA